MASEVERSGGHGVPLLGGDAAQCHVWAFVIVGPHPLRGSLLHLGQTVPAVLAQPLMPNRPVEPLDAVMTQ